MTIELRVLTGARTGHRAQFDGEAVTLGRHPLSDLQLDVDADRDVSARHAEIRVGPDGAMLRDLASTNGTFLGNRRIQGPEQLRDGDIIALGADGPRVQVRLQPPPRLATAERVAVAVNAEVSRIRTWTFAALALLAIGVVGAYWAGSRSAAAETASVRQLLAANDSTTLQLLRQLQAAADTAAMARLQRSNDSLRGAAAALADGSSAADRAALRERMSDRSAGTAALGQLDLATINARNAPAVAFLVTELEGQALAGTAFAVTREGLMVTNRHLVRTPGGAAATRIAVKFRNRSEWIPARVIRVATGAYDDLALLQLDGGTPVPVVAAMRTDAAAIAEGAPVVTIGYPLGRGTAMDGPDGEAFIARTSLFPGTVSKSMADVLQLAAYAGHGSSGSPVFDAAGRVAGVVWGGPAEARGQLVYAVPAGRVAELVRQ